MHDAMRGLIRNVLDEVARTGLPGEHHFFISFDTGHPDVDLADWLKDRFPDEMTIVMQHWFENLDVGDDGFAITLNFGDQPERMFVPYDAIRTFVDPSVEFGLKFESQDTDSMDKKSDPIADLADLTGEPKEMKTASKKKAEPAKSGDKADDKPHDAEVVSLDAFRK